MSQKQGAGAKTPGWVKLFWIGGAALAAAIAILHLTGNGLGGPGRHGPAGAHGARHGDHPR